MPTTERSTIQTVSLLSKGFCEISRLEGAEISPGNYGSFGSMQQIGIPASNVGTVISFQNIVDNYLYIDVEIIGGLAGISCRNPNFNYNAVGGVYGVQGGRYTVRLPYCGPIESLLFTLGSYVIHSISIALNSQYVTEARDLTKLTLLSTVGWTDDGEGFERSFFPGASLRVYLSGTLTSGILSKMQLSTYSASGFPVVEPCVTFFNGINAFSYFFSDKISYCWDYDADLNMQLAYFEVLNNSPELLTVRFVPTVLSFAEISTVYGNN